jgi:hypothetical protein
LKILVLQLKRIGDLVLTFPALAALREAEPGAEVTLVTSGAAGGLAELAPGVARRLNYVKGKPNLGTWAAVVRGGIGNRSTGPPTSTSAPSSSSSPSPSPPASPSPTSATAGSP